MGGVDVGTGGGGKRAVNSEINMIPFIDLLMVTIAFLLITAVWVTNSRMNANAQVPGPPNSEPPDPNVTPEKTLHLYVEEFEFKLVWQQASTVVSESKVPKPEQSGDTIRYSDLATKIGEEWQQHGGHQDPSDTKTDQCVLHADNRLPFRDLVAVLDAIYETKRDMNLGDGTVGKVPVLNMSFSIR